MVASGNDFVLLDNRKVKLNNHPAKLADLSRNICQRKTGIGADGLLFLEKSKKEDIRMRIFNADGSEAEMCGNGARCVAVYLAGDGKIRKKGLTYETVAGQIQAQVQKDTAKIKMTYPKDIKFDIPVDIEPRALRVDYIDTGVPHAIVFVEGLNVIDVRSIGRLIRYHRKFSPRGTNVNFVEVIKGNLIKVRTYERGVENETLACGTGAAASAIITYLKFNQKKKTDFKMRVMTLSTDVLSVYFDYKDEKINNVWLEGKATTIYKGEYYV
jgi:diaminopimelate epimerase